MSTKKFSKAVPIPGTVGFVGDAPARATVVVCRRCGAGVLSIPAGYRPVHHHKQGGNVIEATCCGKQIKVHLEEA